MRFKRAAPSNQKMSLRKKAKLEKLSDLEGPDAKCSSNIKDCIRSAPRKDKGQLIYSKNQFLAVRNVEGSFYLCRVKQLVYENLNKFLIQWLEEDLKHPGNYKLVYFDHVEPECVIDSIKMVHIGSNEFQLPPGEEGRVLALLRSSLKQKRSSKHEDDGDFSTDDDHKAVIIEEGQEEEDDDDEEEDDDDDFLVPTKFEACEPSRKKLRRSSRSKARTQRLSSSPSSLSIRKSVSKRKTVRKVLKESSATPIKRKVPAKNDIKVIKTRSRGVKLKPRPDIQVLKSDPFLYSREKIPFISTVIHSKLVMRAVCLKDLKLLESYVKDTAHVSELNIMHSIDVPLDALKMALKLENLPMVQLLVKELFKMERNRTKTTESMLSSINTGRYNPASLGGIPHIRQVAISRGCREGNNAFTNTSDIKKSSFKDYLKFCFIEGVSKDMLDHFILAKEEKHSAWKAQTFELVILAIRMGHRKLAAAVIADSLKTGSTNFNSLHLNVLQFDDEPLQTPIREASVKKTCWTNDKVTPMHCAAINPNTYYLSTLLNVLPEPGITDSSGRKPIHYAAACVDSGPLELLLDRNQNPDEPDTKGMTALMVACLCGRNQNVDLILKRAASADHEGSKYGVSGINRPNMRPRGDFFSYAPIHFAVHSNSLHCIQTLLEYGANIEKELGPAKNKSSPLMLACSLGHLEVVKTLVQAGANPERRDKIKRTPLMYASMNGHTHVVSYLLNLGCDPDSKDSSGNTPLQYAAAYGWYFCVKLLLSAGSDPNLANDWKMTPLALAFLKGHMGLADLLLEESNLSINFRMENGVTLVMMACMSSMENLTIADQLEYLLSGKKADCSLIDGNEKNALHHLAMNKTDYSEDKHKLVKMADILLTNECDLTAKDSKGLSPLAYALQSDNLELASFLIQRGAKVSELRDPRGDNVLHLLAKQCCKQNVVNILGTIIRNTDKQLLAQMAVQINDEGYSPLLVACREYCNSQGSTPYCYKYRIKLDLSLAEEGEDEDGNEDGQELLENNMSEIQIEAWSNDQKADLVSRNARLFLKLMILTAGFQSFYSQVQPKKKLENVEEKSAKDASFVAKSTSEDSSDEDYDNNSEIRENDDFDEKNEYLYSTEAKFTLLHYMANVSSERCAYFRKPREQNASCNAVEDEINEIDVADVNIDVPIDRGSTSTLKDFEKVRVSSPLLVTVFKLFKKLSGKQPVIQASFENGGGFPLNLEDGRGLTSLMEAVVSNKRDVVARLIKYGADVNKVSSATSSMYKGSSLLLAAKHGSFSIITDLLKSGALHDEVDARTGCTPLHFVIMKKPAAETMYDIVKCLLEHGASVNVQDVMKQTPLHKLAKYSRDQRRLLDTAKLLLDKGASLSIKDKWGRTPLHICLAHNPGTINSSIKLEELFLSQSTAEVDEKDFLGRVPLHYAYFTLDSGKRETDPTSLTSLMTHHSTDPLALVNIRDHKMVTPLHMAAAIGAGVSCIHLIQRSFPRALAAVQAGFRTRHVTTVAVTVAIRNATHSAITRKGANLDAVTDLGNTPLALSVRYGHSSCSLILFMQNCSIDEHIVKSVGSDNDNNGFNGNISLSGSTSKFEITCDADCLTDITDDQLKTPEKSHEKKEKPQWTYLTCLEPPKKSSTVRSYPIIEGIIEQEWQGIISMVLELNQKHSLRLSTIIEAAFKTKKYNLAMNLIERVKTKDDLVVMEKVNSVWSVSSKNLAHLLAKHSFECASDASVVSVAELLLEHKVLFSATDEFGCTPLHYACLSLNIPLINFILGLKNKDIILRKDNAGRTALAALFWRHAHRSDQVFVKAVESLMAAGLTVDFLCRFSIPRHAFLRFGEPSEREPLDYFHQSLITGSVRVPGSPMNQTPRYLSSPATGVRRINAISLSAQSSTSSSTSELPLSFTMVLSPLALAVIIENIKLVEILVTLGADVNLGDGWGRSPIMFALALNDMKIVRHLLADHAIPTNDLPHVFFDFEKENDKVRQGLKKAVGQNLFQLGVKSLVQRPDGEDDVVVSRADGDGDDNNETSSKKCDGANDFNKDYVSVCMEFPSLSLKSKADLNHIDNQGHSVVHYLVPLDSKEELIGDGDDGIGDIKFPSYDNHILLLQLHSLGAKINVPNGKGQTLKERACKAGCQKLLLAMKHLESRGDTIGVDEKVTFRYHTVSDNIDWSPFEGVVNPNKDAHSFLEKFNKELGESESTASEFKPSPDKNISEYSISQVLWDEDLKVPFDTLLFKIDVKLWQQGMYNFYKMQVVHQKSKDLYILFTRWGRIGDTGQYQQTPFSTKEEALKEFRKIFKSKSGNEWENYHSFEEKHLKYRLVSLESRKPVIKKHIDINLKTSLPSKLHPYIQDFIKELTNMPALKNIIDQSGFNTPVALGCLRKKDLDKAREILNRILISANKFTELRKTSFPDLHALEKQSNELADLSNEYYHILPKKDFLYEKVPILNNESAIKEELANLDLLFDIEIATRFMIAAMEKKEVMNTLDYIYKSMDCQIVLLEKMSLECQYLLRYISTSWKGKVEAIFKIQSKSDDKKFQGGDLPSNRKLLFHGSNICNLISILTRGLLISPPGVQLTGDAFGNGIYLADTFRKSSNYCRSGTNGLKFMLICEANLGKMKAVMEYLTTLPVGMDSILALGNEVPDPIHDIVTPSGAILPLGKVVQTNKRRKVPIYRFLERNEYIVYSAENVALRYVIQFKDK